MSSLPSPLADDKGPSEVPVPRRHRTAAGIPWLGRGPLYSLLESQRRRRGIFAQRETWAVLVPLITLFSFPTADGTALEIEFFLGLIGIGWVVAESWARMRSLRNAGILRDLSCTCVFLRDALEDASRYTVRRTAAAAWVCGGALLFSSYAVIDSALVFVLFGALIYGLIRALRAFSRIGSYWGFGYNLRDAIAHGVSRSTWEWFSFLIYDVLLLVVGLFMMVVSPLLTLGVIILVAVLFAVTVGVEHRPVTEEAMREILEGGVGARE